MTRHFVGLLPLLIQGCAAVQPKQQHAPLQAQASPGPVGFTEEITFDYNASENIANPWVGLVPFASSTPCDFPHSMENHYFSFAWLMTNWGTFNFADIEEKLNDIAARGHQAIFRVYLEYPGKTKKPTDGVPEFLIEGLTFYSSASGDDEWVTPDYNNATLIDAIVELIHKLGDTYDDDSRLAFWQVGFLGEWGEWHNANSHAHLSNSEVRSNHRNIMAEWKRHSTEVERNWYQERASRVRTTATDYPMLGIRYGDTAARKAAMAARQNRAVMAARHDSNGRRHAVAPYKHAKRKLVTKLGAKGPVHVPGQPPHVPGTPVHAADAPVHPTEPEGTCWIYKPTGCPDGDGAGADSDWYQDTWGMANGYDGKDGCKKRQNDLNGWCGTSDILTYYVDPLVPPSPPAPHPPPFSAPPAPTEPEGSCWIIRPTGCPDGDGAGADSDWYRDSWGEENGYDGEDGCAKRQTDLNGWCGTTDILTNYVAPLKPPSPPAPMYPPAPDSPEYSCWYIQPSGCPDGDGGGPQSLWTRDSWGEQQPEYQGSDGCALRQDHFNEWCGVHDIKTSYVYPAIPPSPPVTSPPSPPPTPDGGAPFADPDVQKRVLEAFDEAFVKTALLVRYPDVTGGIPPEDIRIGFHDDSFDQDTIDLPGQREDWVFVNRMEDAGASDRWQDVPIAGEVRPELQSCIFAEDISIECDYVGGRPALDFNECSAATKSSWQWDHTICYHGGYSPEDTVRAKEAASKMGYSFHLVSLAAAETAVDGSSAFAVRATIQNKGVAPPYYPTFLTVSYPCGASGTNTTIGDVGRMLPSTNSTEIFTSEDIKVGTGNGATDACVFLTSPRAPGLKPIIRFAIDGADPSGVVWLKA